MLNYCDIYPLELPARYSNKYACFEMVYIISNWSLQTQYQDYQKEDKVTWNAFLRRINKVKVFTKDGVTVYQSVQEYYEQLHGFQPVKESPF